jgi:hypothetical protein
VVTNIAHIALAPVRSCAKRDPSRLCARRQPGAEAGSAQSRLDLPPVLDIAVVEATAPTTCKSRRSTSKSVLLPRQSMKDTWLSQMDPKTQITSLHGVSMLEAAQYPMKPTSVSRCCTSPAGRTTASWSTLQSAPNPTPL